MALFLKGRDLDAWAVALDAKTDDEAIASLRRLLGRVVRAGDDLADLRNETRALPSDEAAQLLFQALANTRSCEIALLSVIESFQRHERGR